MNSSISGRIRQPAAAGRFYPRDPVELRKLVVELLGTANAPAAANPKALISPHAGFMYSGPIAASAYAHFGAAGKQIKRVVLLGPSHFVALAGLATSSAEAFATPLGTVPVDTAAVRQLASLPQISLMDEAHEFEHSLEVQLPFLQVVLEEFSIVPLVVGEASAEQVDEVIEALWDGPETRFVISSDLSHYLDWDSARRLDEATARAVEALKPQEIHEQQACGRIPILGLLRAARNHQLHAHTADLRSSGDTAGPRHQVVGYGAFVFEGRQ